MPHPLSLQRTGLTSKLFDTLSSPLRPIHAMPTRPRRRLGILHLTTGPCRVQTHLSPTRTRMLDSTRQDRHRGCFTSSVDDSLSSSRPRLEVPQCPTLVSRSPDYPHGTVGEWSFAEDLSLLASSDVRPIDSSSVGFLRAFIDDLRADRRLVESSASFENNHSAVIELNSSSDTSISAYRPCQLRALKSSRASPSSAFRLSDGPDLVVLDTVDWILG